MPRSTMHEGSNLHSGKLPISQDIAHEDKVTQDRFIAIKKGILLRNAGFGITSRRLEIVIKRTGLECAIYTFEKR